MPPWPVQFVWKNCPRGAHDHVARHEHLPLLHVRLERYADGDGDDVVGLSRRKNLTPTPVRHINIDGIGENCGILCANWDKCVN